MHKCKVKIICKWGKQNNVISKRKFHCYFSIHAFSRRNGILADYFASSHGPSGTDPDVHASICSFLGNKEEAEEMPGPPEPNY